MAALKGQGGRSDLRPAPRDFHAENLTWDHGFPSFDVVWNDEPKAHITLQVPGEHNVKNAIAAAAAALVLGIPGWAIQQGLQDFWGAGRRFEFKGKAKGADIYDDYAHHPGELKALLGMPPTWGTSASSAPSSPIPTPGTKALFDEFAEVLKKPDVTFLAQIFAARETNEVGISSDDLAAAIPGAKAAANFAQLTDWLYDMAQPAT